MKAVSREDETFGETLEHLVSDYSLTEFAGDVDEIWSFDLKEFEHQLDADDGEARSALDEQLHLEWHSIHNFSVSYELRTRRRSG